MNRHIQKGAMSMRWNAFRAAFKGLTFRERTLLSFLMLPAHLLLHVEKGEHLRSIPRPFIVACNHNNAVESLLVPAALMFLLQGEKISFVIDWMFGKVPLLGSLIELIDPVYVYRKQSTWRRLELKRPSQPQRSVLEECSRRLSLGRCVGIFPEGVRNHDSAKLLKGRRGIGHMALRNGVSVLPVGIDYPLRVKKGRIPLIGRTTVRIGAPMHFPLRIAEYRAASALTGRAALCRSTYLAACTTYDIMLELAHLCGKRYDFPSPSTDNLESANVTTQEDLCRV